MRLKNLRRSGQRGLSLLEVMVSISVLTTALVAFASIFPAAFKLNRNTQASVRAGKYASMVAEEIRSLPIAGSRTESFYTRANSGYLEGLVGLSSGNIEEQASNLKSVQEIVASREAATKGDGEASSSQIFSLDPIEGSSVGYPGIYVTGPKTYSLDVSDVNQAKENSSRFWNIMVTVYWREKYQNAFIERSSTVVSARTGNRE